jgi:hypothetical protein
MWRKEDRCSERLNMIIAAAAGIIAALATLVAGSKLAWYSSLENKPVQQVGANGISN